MPHAHGVSKPEHLADRGVERLGLDNGEALLVHDGLSAAARTRRHLTGGRAERALPELLLEGEKRDPGELLVLQASLRKGLCDRQSCGRVAGDRGAESRAAEGAAAEDASKALAIAPEDELFRLLAQDAGVHPLQRRVLRCGQRQRLKLAKEGDLILLAGTRVRRIRIGAATALAHDDWIDALLHCLHPTAPGAARVHHSSVKGAAAWWHGSACVLRRRALRVLKRIRRGRIAPKGLDPAGQVARRRRMVRRRGLLRQGCRRRSA
mmetsp:Transcript_4731/g.18913  ORF Transcript_4731/g.18913 Transcript_4731/m.18913 type:complete len:265 (-) Transcript_4731:1126-1920(-)